MASFVVDTSTFPVVSLRFDGPLDDAAFRAYLDGISGILDRGERYALVLDATRAVPPTAAQRRMQAEHIRQQHARIQLLCVGGAFVISSPIIRGALAAILWMQPLPWPHTVVGDVAAGERWARKRLAGG